MSSRFLWCRVEVATKLGSMSQSDGCRSDLAATFGQAMTQGNNAFVPDKFAMNKSYYRGRQEDAHEFLMQILSVAHEQPLVDMITGRDTPWLQCIQCGFRSPAGVEDFGVLSLHIRTQDSQELRSVRHVVSKRTVHCSSSNWLCPSFVGCPACILCMGSRLRGRMSESANTERHVCAPVRMFDSASQRGCHIVILSQSCFVCKSAFLPSRGIKR